jgi:hypothetical protein
MFVVLDNHLKIPMSTKSGERGVGSGYPVTILILGSEKEVGSNGKVERAITIEK